MNARRNGDGPGITEGANFIDKNEALRSVASSLILRQSEGAVKSPVVTLSTERTCLYNVLEKHVKAEALLGADKWWRVCKSLFRPPLEVWRPRVNGIQLKALHGARLPESNAEWDAVRRNLHLLGDLIKDDSSPDAFLSELQDLAVFTQDWWDNRTKREGSAGPSRRASSMAPVPSSKRQRLGEMDAYGQGNMPEGLPASANILKGAIGEPLQGFMELMNVEQPAGMSNGLIKHHGVAMPSPEHQQISRLSSRASAVTVLAGEIQQTEIVPINVGGHFLQTELSTLTAVPSSHLAQLARHWQTFPLQSIFLDRNPKVFEGLLEQLRAVRAGEETLPMPTDIELLRALAREARYFALDAIAVRLDEALGLALAKTTPSPPPQSRASSEDIWEFDVAFADSGFHVDVKEAIQVPLKSLNAELQDRLTTGWEIYSASSNTVGRPGRGGSEERNLSVQFLLRRLRSMSPSVPR